MKKLYTLSTVILSLFILQNAIASKLLEVKILDKDYIHLHFLDGEATFVDDGNGACPNDHCEDLANNDYIPFGSPLNTSSAQNKSSYTIKSSDHATFGTSGLEPTQVFRKSQIGNMVQRSWQNDDYTYDFGDEHQIFLKLPNSLEQGKTYTVEIAGGTNSDQTSVTFTYDIFTTRSEAVKVNLVGYTKTDAVKAADVYYWMGDGDARDYTSFIGNKVFIYDVNSKTSTEVGTLSFGAAEATEQAHGHKMLKSDVWNADFTGFTTGGTYKIAIEGIGCSDEFAINDEIYKDPFGVSVQGFFYMRIGQEQYADGYPVPRQPLWIPNTSPADCKVYITTMQPYHPEWGNMCNGCDKWDIKAGVWDQYKKPGNPTNPNAYGGHSDALDWDRYLGHVSIIYDMLLPYIVTEGAQSDDDLGIAESGNGIPDLLDEAQNEVDFWLRLRDGKGYSHGINNPDGNNVFYQAGNTAVAAWANAANSAMMAYAFEIAGKTNLKNQYRDSAEVAYNYASGLADQQLDKTQGVGFNDMSGADFKMLAAAYLYNVTGNTDYEIVLNATSGISSETSPVTLSNIYALAGYLFTPQTVHYQSLYDNIKSAVIYHAKDKEANYSLSRPSRRATDNNIAWMQTEIGVHRTIVAHAIATSEADKSLFENALTLEADYSLGRNPLNRILMTTATTNLANERSIENAFTSGWDDGSPGVHPGHTPYMNPYSWGGNRYMGNPTRMAEHSYPTVFPGSQNAAGLQWPMGEMYFNTRYVYAHSEFTPQQTMRGKTALYAYLYAIGSNCDRPDLGADVSFCGLTEVELNTRLSTSGKTFLWEGPSGIINGATGSKLVVDEPGIYTVTVNESGCVKSDKINVKGELPSVFLGDDVDLCKTSSVLLDAGISGNGYNYSWEKDDKVIAGVTTKTYEAKSEGVYKVTVSVTGCTSQSDEIEITSSLIPVKQDSICGEGMVSLEVNGSGSYTWHVGENTEDLLSTELIYEPTISQTTTYFVEEAGAVSTNVGPSKPGTVTWGDWAGAFDDKTKFTTSVAINLKSIRVDVISGGNVTVNLYSSANGTPIKSKTQAVSNNLETIELDFDIPTPGTYYLNLTGTTASLTMDNEDGDYIKYPYAVDNVISITGTEPGWIADQGRYMFLYDWNVEYTGSNCVRTPVTGTILDPADPACKVTSVSHESKNSLEIFPNPTTGVVHFSKEVSFEIMDAMGQQLIKSEADKVDLSIYPSGVYLIKTTFGISKIVKQ